MSEASKRGKEIRPSRNAWMPEDEGTRGKEEEDNLSARLRYLSLCSNVTSTATSGNSFASNEEGNVQSPRGVRPLGASRNKYAGEFDPHYTSRQVSDISKTNDWSYHNNRYHREYMPYYWTHSVNPATIKSSHLSVCIIYFTHFRRREKETHFFSNLWGNWWVLIHIYISRSSVPDKILTPGSGGFSVMILSKCHVRSLRT